MTDEKEKGVPKSTRRKEGKKQFSFRTYQAVIDQVDEAKWALKMSRNDFIEECILDYLTRNFSPDTDDTPVI